MAGASNDSEDSSTTADYSVEVSVPPPQAVSKRAKVSKIIYNFLTFFPLSAYTFLRKFFQSNVYVDISLILNIYA